MKPTYEIDPELLDNRKAFHGEFFSRFSLRTAREPLELTDGIKKSYLFPTLYGDVSCAIGIFLCSYEKARELMLHPSIKPVRMPRGRALVIFSCYVYRNVLGVPPYNEIAMTIPVLVKPRLDVPVLPMLVPIFKSFGYFVFSMPVTSLENQLRGRKIWGLPKVVQEIDVTETDTEMVTEAFEEGSGERYFRLRVPKAGKATRFDVASHLYSRLGDALLQSTTCFMGTFNVNKYPEVLWRRGKKASVPSLEIGDTSSGRLLQQLQIEEQPFQFRYAANMASCFDLPNSSYVAPLRFVDRERP